MGHSVLNLNLHVVSLVKICDPGHFQIKGSQNQVVLTKLLIIIPKPEWSRHFSGRYSLRITSHLGGIPNWRSGYFVVMKFAQIMLQHLFLHHIPSMVCFFTPTCEKKNTRVRGNHCWTFVAGYSFCPKQMGCKPMVGKYLTCNMACLWSLPDQFDYHGHNIHIPTW